MGLHFEGDPAVDSKRRHMERVLKADKEGRRGWRWPLVLMALSGGGLWAFLRGRAVTQPGNDYDRGSRRR